MQLFNTFTFIIFKTPFFSLPEAGNVLKNKNSKQIGLNRLSRKKHQWNSTPSKAKSEACCQAGFANTRTSPPGQTLSLCLNSPLMRIWADRGNPKHASWQVRRAYSASCSRSSCNSVYRLSTRPQLHARASRCQLDEAWIPVRTNKKPNGDITWRIKNISR